MKLIKNIGILLGAAWLASSQASADMASYGFYKLSNNNAEDLSSQLSISVWDADAANTEFGTDLLDNEILFTVHNNVGISSNITEVYFDDGLLGPSEVINSLDGYTAFTGGGAAPGNLPGGEDAAPVFEATQNFSADVDPGSPDKGVNASDDILGIVLGLGSFDTFDDITAAVADGSLRFGLHVRSIGDAGGSDSYINTPDTITEVPVPAAAWLFGSALLCLGRFKKH
jgi:hypothetical protein